jgi:hypothetical protein
LQTQRANFKIKGFNKYKSVKENCISFINPGLGYYKKNANNERYLLL